MKNKYLVSYDKGGERHFNIMESAVKAEDTADTARFMAARSEGNIRSIQVDEISSAFAGLFWQKHGAYRLHDILRMSIRTNESRINVALEQISHNLRVPDWVWVDYARQFSRYCGVVVGLPEEISKMLSPLRDQFYADMMYDCVKFTPRALSEIEIREDYVYAGKFTTQNVVRMVVPKSTGHLGEIETWEG